MSENFLNKNLKAQSIKEKNDKRGYIKLRNIYTAKETITEFRNNLQNERKLPTIYPIKD